MILQLSRGTERAALSVSSSRTLLNSIGIERFISAFRVVEIGPVDLYSVQPGRRPLETFSRGLGIAPLPGRLGAIALATRTKTAWK